MELKGRRALVTGSTKGIGLAIARSLLEAGCRVVVSSRHPEDVRDTVTRLEAIAADRVLGRSCNVREEKQVQELVQFAVEQMGGLDILVNNAGIGIFKTVEEMSPAQWRDVIQTNLDGVFYACHHALPALKKGARGFIVNIGSLAGRNAFPKGAAYNASKFGLNGFSEALMQEVRHDDVRVATIMPGSVDTGFSSNPPPDASWKLTAQDVAEAVLYTLKHHPRCLTSRVEMRPSRPPRK